MQVFSDMYENVEQVMCHLFDVCRNVGLHLLNIGLYVHIRMFARADRAKCYSIPSICVDTGL